MTCVNKYATVKWQPNGDNRAPIKYYSIEYNYSSAPNHWLVAKEEIPAYEQTYTLRMKAWTNSTFRITATNIVGKSNSSEHSDICITEPDVPYKNPDNVEVQPGPESSAIVISWKVRYNFQIFLNFIQRENIKMFSHCLKMNITLPV